MKFLAIIITLFLAGCYAPKNELPKDIFLQVQEVQKPVINSLDDIQNSYIQLFRAYELNLNLLKTIENTQKN